MQLIKQRMFYVCILISIGLFTVGVRTYILAFSSKSKKTKHHVLRGPIYDRHGFILAVSEEASTIAIAPQEVYDYEQLAELLAKPIQMTPTEILQAIYERKNSRYFYLKRKVDNFQADKITDIGLLGVYREREYRRYYPGKKLASNLLGFVGQDQSNALSGIERNFNAALIHATPQSTRNGSILQLSIDSKLQYHLEAELEKGYITSESKRATGILMDIQTGAILAMASLPNFDPNEYYKSVPAQRSNWNIRLNYEPGSTIKVIIAAILLSEKAVNLSQRFLCEGEIHFHDSLVRCRYKGKATRHGKLTLSEIIEKSCNVGIIKAAQKIKPESMYRYMQKLGFGKATGILPSRSGETSGYFPTLRNWVPSTSYYMPIGQGFSVTPIQLLRAMTSLVNGGKLLRPYIAWRIRSSENNVILNEQQSIWEQSPFDESINRKVRQMMEKVVIHGTGRAAEVSKVGVMGKTGTGEKSSAHGYLDKYVVSFAGFFPRKKPRYATLILFDEPKSTHSGGSLAAPVFAKFVRKIIPLLESRSHMVSPQKLSLLPIHHRKIKKTQLYDFRGLAARDAIQIISSFYKIKVKLKGSGYVYKQYPPPNTNVRDIHTVRLQLRELY